ncbi:MAG: hypothetical protein M1820_007365 [Bogoriella megaspora]|nr:MAG: hypothetical protein M1820_007365 [Bogoriella megaspora]
MPETSLEAPSSPLSHIGKGGLEVDLDADSQEARLLPFLTTSRQQTLSFKRAATGGLEDAKRDFDNFLEENVQIISGSEDAKRDFYTFLEEKVQMEWGSQSIPPINISALEDAKRDFDNFLEKNVQMGWNSQSILFINTSGLEDAKCGFDNFLEENV